MENIDQEKKQLKREEIKKRLRDREVEDLKKLLSLPEGRRFLWRLMSEAGIFRNSFTGNSTTFFNEGKREIGLLIIGEVMNANSSAFTKMQNEFTNEQKIIAKQMESLND